MELENKRILITRPRSQAEDFAHRLQALGAIPVYFPVIEISPIQETAELDQALQQLDQYDWLVLTSVNGVQVVWDRLDELLIEDLPDRLKVAAIGPKTAAALRQVGVVPDFVPDEYVAEAILPGLGELSNLRVLLLRADLARAALPQAIEQAGGMAHEIAVYNTLPAQPDPQELRDLQLGVDIVTFTSSSTVRNFVSLARQAGLDHQSLPGEPLIACIGPITAQTALEQGLNVDLVASEYTTQGLIQALLEFPSLQITPGAS